MTVTAPDEHQFAQRARFVYLPGLAKCRMIPVIKPDLDMDVAAARQIDYGKKFARTSGGRLFNDHVAAELDCGKRDWCQGVVVVDTMTASTPGVSTAARQSATARAPGHAEASASARRGAVSDATARQCRPLKDRTRFWPIRPQPITANLILYPNRIRDPAAQSGGEYRHRSRPVVWLLRPAWSKGPRWRR